MFTHTHTLTRVTSALCCVDDVDVARWRKRILKLTHI